MDITLYSGNGFLTLTDSGPTCFTVWRQLAHEDVSTIMQELRFVFFERSVPAEILTDNASTFCCQTFLTFIDKWGIQVQHQCACVPEDNGIVERCHCTVKRIATRSRCSIVKAVYWYNATPKDNEMPSSMPANGIYQYEQCMKGIDPQTAYVWSQK